jgi:hypothetical protein
MIPPTIAATFGDDFCVAPVDSTPLPAPALTPGDGGLVTVEVKVAVIVEVTALGVIVVVTVETSGVLGGVTIMRSRKKGAPVPV